jgi:hypothetical protein
VRLEISGGRSSEGRRVRHVIYLSGAEQHWLGEMLMETAPDLGRRVLAAQQPDLVVVGRGGELRALRQRLERYKTELVASVEGKNIRLQRKLFPDAVD